MSLNPKTLIRLAVSLGLLAGLLLFMVDIPSAWKAVRHCDWSYMAWLALWITLDRVLMSYKWRLLVVCRGLGLGHWQALKAYYLASFAGCFLPSTVGADAMRIAAVRGENRPSEVIAASVVMERSLGFLASAVAAAAACFLLASLKADLPPGLFPWSLALMAGLGLAMIFSLSRRPAAWLRSLPERLRHRGAAFRWAGRFLSAYADYRDHASTLAVFLLLSILEQSGPVVGTWLAAKALHIDLGLLQAAAVTPVALLFTRIPVSVSGFGVVEGLYVAFFSLVGLNATDSFLLGLVATLSIVVTTVPGAFFYTSSGFRAAGR